MTEEHVYDPCSGYPPPSATHLQRWEVFSSVFIDAKGTHIAYDADDDLDRGMNTPMAACVRCCNRRSDVRYRPGRAASELLHATHRRARGECSSQRRLRALQCSL